MTYYKLTLTQKETESLHYIAQRYTYAKCLFDSMYAFVESGDSKVPTTYHLDESDAWEFHDAVESEDGQFPLMGGTLLDKVLELYQEIV